MIGYVFSMAMAFARLAKDDAEGLLQATQKVFYNPLF